MSPPAPAPSGARPKANLRLDTGQLGLAKLPHSKDGERVIRDLLDAADAFQLRREEAAEIAASVASAVDGWSDLALELGVPTEEIRAMSTAFDADQRKAAKAA